MICENCGKEHDGSYASGRFCCKECAKAFSTKNEVHGLKEAKCIKCGKTIYINKRASINKCVCDDCKSETKTCSICGRHLNKYGECDSDFCKKHNHQHFKSLIKYFGFDKSKYRTTEVENEFNRIRDLLYNLYWVENKSSSEIANLFGYKSTPTNITQKFFKNYLNIPVKNVSYSVAENYIEGRSQINTGYNQYKQQWHKTWDNNNVFLRSSYELDYAEQLDQQKIHYEVEKLNIKYFDSVLKMFRCAIPDFYIPSQNLIVEIKCDYTLDIQNMKDKFSAYQKLGYKTKLILNKKEVDLYQL